MAEYGIFFRGVLAEEDSVQAPQPSGTYALHTLAEQETIARLANGIRRFRLPDEQNFIKIYRQIVEDDKTGYGEQALSRLAENFENRRQYARAAESWRTSIQKYGSTSHKAERLQQIVGHWGRFESLMSQPAGQGASVEFRFRNGRKAKFTAYRIKVKKLLDDVKTYLKSSPRQLDGNQLEIGNIGHRLVTQNQRQYLGPQVAEWELELEPREYHFDKRITVATPLRDAGAYLVTAEMEGGNTSKIVVWISDTVIVKKPLEGQTMYYVADAVTGAPIGKANVELFGFRQRHVGGNRFQVDTRQFAEFSSADGIVLQQIDNQANEYQWIATATTSKGRLAFLGFTSVWAARYDDAAYQQVKVFTITDRPVYRPKQKVHFKFWVRHAKYDDEESTSFAHQTFQVEIHNPKNEKVFSQAVTADEYGGIEGEYELPSDATLGA
jgi:hypothetical protein